MYNGVGLKTPRGSGSNGHVQRSCALVRPSDQSKIYKTGLLDKVNIKQPNREILEHEKKRKLEVRCVEFASLLEEQGFSKEAIAEKVKKLSGTAMEVEKPTLGRVNVTETHQVAKAQKEKAARLRKAFGIPDHFVEGSSFNRSMENKSQEIVKLIDKKNNTKGIEEGKNNKKTDQKKESHTSFRDELFSLKRTQIKELFKKRRNY